MSRSTLSLISLALLFLFNACSNAKDKDVTPPDFLRVKDNNVTWTATTITATLGPDDEPIMIQGNTAGQQLVIRLDDIEPGPYSLQRDILPAVLTGFEVQYSGSDHQVIWQTGSETNLSFFDVETSGNGTDWTKVGTEAAIGGGAGNIIYAHTVKSIAVGNPVFYRLKMVDIDAQFAYSSVRSLNTNYKSSFQPLGDQVRRGYAGLMVIKTLDRSKRFLTGEFHFSVTSSTGVNHTLNEGEFSIHY